MQFVHIHIFECFQTFHWHLKAHYKLLWAMTVLLAWQHYDSIKRRLSSFACLHYLVMWFTWAVLAVIYNRQQQSSDKRIGRYWSFLCTLKWVARLKQPINRLYLGKACFRQKTTIPWFTHSPFPPKTKICTILVSTKIYFCRKTFLPITIIWEACTSVTTMSVYQY